MIRQVLFKWLKWLGLVACAAAVIFLVWIIYLAIIDIPDSTDYFLQEVDSSERGVDDRDYIYVGDNLHIRAYNWRHKRNGTCLIGVDRMRENVGGKFDGKRHLIQHVDQYFAMDGIIRQTSWPIGDVTIPITKDWFDDEEAEEQEMDIFTTGYFDCDFLDQIRLKLGVPRVHHNGEGLPERERTRVVLRRNR